MSEFLQLISAAMKDSGIPVCRMPGSAMQKEDPAAWDTEPKRSAQLDVAERARAIAIEQCVKKDLEITALRQELEQLRKDKEILASVVLAQHQEENSLPPAPAYTAT